MTVGRGLQRCCRSCVVGADAEESRLGCGRILAADEGHGWTPSDAGRSRLVPTRLVKWTEDSLQV